ncbi:MAG: hypothetical protein M0P12_00745 [Paludibacteraceae bacterium]|nr:hypothetical protein [Paludibacteraceae bacterium]MCK9616098.1 hypothetical protein [Candidatus Omnitrophota bacterium]
MEVDDIINGICKHGDCVEIKFPFIIYSGIEIPAKESEKEKIFLFKEFTLKDSIELDKLSYSIKLTNGLYDASHTDYNIYRYLLLRRTVFSMDDKIFERENGWVSEKDWEILKSYPAPIINYALSLYEDSFSMSEEERKKMERETALLFGSKSGKVFDPSPGISSTFTLESLWDKFGLTKADIEKMTLKEYSKIKLILTKEAEKMRDV